MNKFIIPLSIVLAGGLIAAAIIFSKDVKPSQQLGGNGTNEPAQVELAPVTDSDHIYGNPDAKVFVVEYSDFECPFCKQFHPTMERIMSEYGTDGDVAWVYRHYPLNFHPRALPAAEASECAAIVGGNDAFWNYSDYLFTNSPDSIASTESLQAAAVAVGLNGDEFAKCVSEGRGKQAVADDIADGNRVAQADPNFGTPYNVVVAKSGEKYPIVGAYPYEQVKLVIDTMLKAN